VVPDSKAFDLAVFYRDRAPVLYRDRLGGHYAAEPFQGTPPDESLVEADFDNDGRMDRASVAPTARFTWRSTAAAARRTGSACGSKASRISSWRRMRRWKSRPGRYTQGHLCRYAALFDTGVAAAVDVVRITCPNGLIQNEPGRRRGGLHISGGANGYRLLPHDLDLEWPRDAVCDRLLGVAPWAQADGRGHVLSGEPRRARLDSRRGLAAVERR